MKILIVSQYPWNKENSFGNTYSSIFSKVKNIEIAQIYLMEGEPDDEPVVTRYYQIPEGQVLKSIMRRDKKHAVGKEVFLKSNLKEIPQKQDDKTSWYNKLLLVGKRHHWRWMFWLRELGWKFGNVNFDGMMNFIADFKPDIFFLPYNHIFYTNRIALYIKKRLDVPMVLEMSMDHYSMKMVSYDPFFWIDRLLKRRVIRKLVRQSSFMYVISKKMKEEYEDLLGIECKLLYKTPDITRQQFPYSEIHNPIRYLFTGNIHANRWKSLAMLASELSKQGGGHLDIYTASPITKEIDGALNISGISEIHGPVSQQEVISLQNNADVLVHAEAFDRFNRMLVRCAISTKIMDYLCVGRSILAIGPSDISSIEYLADDDLAITACTANQVTSAVNKINADSKILYKYATCGREYVLKNLDAQKKRNSLYNDLQMAIDNYEKA